jgi:hypothetical protein
LTDELSKSEASRLRKEIVETAIRARGVRSELVLDAMRSVARESFLPERLREFAYEDTALLIEEAQTISQPYYRRPYDRGIGARWRRNGARSD